METTLRIPRPSMWPSRFSRDVRYEWKKSIKVNGKMTAIGSPVRNSDFSTRKLTMFLNAGYIKPCDVQQEQPSEFSVDYTQLVPIPEPQPETITLRRGRK